MSDDRPAVVPLTGAYTPNAGDREFSERSLDTIVNTTPVVSNIVNVSNPSPEGEDFDA